jgi:hypothetical protein
MLDICLPFFNRMKASKTNEIEIFDTLYFT